MITYSKLHNLVKDFKVLYVEDDKSFQEDTYEILQNFFSLIDLASHGEEAYNIYLDKTKENKNYYDIVITDIFMPKINGLELSKLIYQHNKEQPIIIISAHNESKYLVDFINIGVDYFIVKPFDLNEIIEVLYNTSIKILNSISHQRPVKNQAIVELANNFTWDKNSSILFYKENYIELTKKETLFIEILIKNGNGVSSIEEILDTLWYDSIDLVSTNTLNPIISRLRKKLPQKLIKSIYASGYKLEFQK